MFLVLTAVVALVAQDGRALSARAIELADEMRLPEAAAAAEEARRRAVGCGDRAGEALALDAAGVVERLSGRAEIAVALTEEALALARDAGDAGAAARAWNDLGRIRADLLHDRDGARDAYRHCLDLAGENHGTAARAFNNRANLEREEGRGSRALNDYRSALREARADADAPLLRAAEHNIGLLLAQQNDPAAALPHLQRALAMERRGSAAARILLSLSECARALHRPAAALRDLQRAERMAAEAGDGVTLAMARMRRGDLAIRAHAFAAAERSLQRALTAAQRTHDEATIAAALVFLAQLLEETGRRSEALSLCRRAAASARAAGDLHLLAVAGTIAGRVYRRSGALPRAEESFREAVAAIERERAGVAGGFDSRQRFFAEELAPYLALVDIAIDEERPADALHYAESAKARVLVDTEPARTSPAHAMPAGADVVVEYVLTPTHLVAFIVRDGDPRIVVCPATPQAARDRVRSFSAKLMRRDLRFREPARALYDILIAPLHALLRPGDRLCIIPDGPLWQLPFPALIAPDGRYLIERHAVSYAPSLLALREKPASPPRREVFAAGNAGDDLDDAAREIHAIENIYGPRATVLLGGAATEERVKRELPEYRVVHLATHGVADERSPMESYLLLAPTADDDGTFEAKELMHLRLRADLVVLSACESGSGRNVAGEGVVGLAWSALAAGASSVISAQWRIESASTALVMTRLHARLAEHSGAAEALQSAQRSLLGDARYRHPFYWAAFSIVTTVCSRSEFRSARSGG